jgi:DNA polymerase-3 subunit epsilon
LNPERDIDEGAQQVHGLSREQLSTEPKFAQVHDEFLEFVREAELIIHNAPFDIAFLNAELARVANAGSANAASAGAGLRKMTDLCRVLDTLALARQMHPGQRNNLDALCKRYSVDNSHREYHGALLDARILADVYLAMTGGQAKFTLSAESDNARSRARQAAPTRFAGVPIVVVKASEEELAAHEQVLALLDKASRGTTVWRKL